MNSKRDLANIAEAYEGLLEQVSANMILNEKKQSQKVSAKKGIAAGSFDVVSKKPTEKKDPFAGKKSGPTAADGFKAELIDTKNKKKKGNFYTPEKFSQLKTEKTETLKINNCMRSTFDKLFENVMSGELDAAPPTNELDSETGGSNLTGDGLDTDTDLDGGEPEGDLKTMIADALALLQKIQDQVGGAEDLDDSPDLSGDLDAGGDGLDGSDAPDSELSGEATDIQELGDKSASLKKVSGKSNQVGDTTSKMVDGKEGDGKVTDKVGNEKGKEGKPTAVTGKANVVSSSKTSKVGGDLFAK